MKKEFPALWANVSTFIATPVIIAVSVAYMHSFVYAPYSKSYEFALSAIGISAALSAICLSAMLPIEANKTLLVFRYAGEKFLHSCLLLIQALIIAFARDNILLWDWFVPFNGLRRAVELIADTAGLLVTATAAFCWYWAFEGLNKQLWANWRQRVQEMNHSGFPPAVINAEESQSGTATPERQPPT